MRKRCECCPLPPNTVCYPFYIASPLGGVGARRRVISIHYRFRNPSHQGKHCSWPLSAPHPARNVRPCISFRLPLAVQLLVAQAAVVGEPLAWAVTPVPGSEVRMMNPSAIC